MSLAQQTLSGFIWTLTSRMGTRLSIFIVGVILARLLTPADFGLVAMLSIFFAISGGLIDSGFTQALIREKEISQKDKSTVFIINIVISIVLYFILWISSPKIAEFYRQPQLLWLTRVMGLDLIFKSLSLVQRAVFLQSLRFKMLSVIDISIAIITGIIAIILAIAGLGVWALAIKYFLSSLLSSLIFWNLNPWLPNTFSKDSFNKLFGFGSKLMISGIINNIYGSIYNIIIGKLYSSATLGFYNRAEMFTNQTVSTVLTALQQVTYSTLSKTQENRNLLKAAYSKIITSISFINFPFTVLLAFIAEPMIQTLLGSAWSQVVPFIQALCISAFISHLNNLNVNIYFIVGKSDIYLRISILTKFIITLFIIIGIQFGIWGIIIGSVLTQYIMAIINMKMVSRLIKYKIIEQLKDVMPIIALLIPMFIVLTFMLHYINVVPLIKLILMGSTGIIVYLLTAYLLKSQALSYILILIKPYIRNQQLH